MLPVFQCLVFRLVTLLLPQVATSDDQLYRCTDGMFTNRVERQCAYESKCMVQVQGGIAEASKQPVAEVKLFDKPVERQAKAR